MNGHRALAWCAGLSVAVAVVAGCERREGAYVAPPPPEVFVAPPVNQEVTIYCTFTGTTEGVEKGEARARVKGFLQEIHYVPGRTVKGGDLLFTIDPSTYKIAVDQAAAKAQGHKASLDIIEIQFTKIKELLAKQAATQLEVDEWKAKRDEAQAAHLAALASLEDAKLNLQYTQVRAPIDGVVGENLVDVGTLVGATDPTLLATVIRNDQVYAYFDMSERDLLQLITDRSVPGENRRELGTTPIEMGLANQADYPFIGMVDFADNTLDPDTGTLKVRAVFDNADGRLFPGLFVRLRAAIAKREMWVVQDAALGQDQGGRFVLIVEKDGVVERRAVELGPQIGALRAVAKGLEGGESIIVRGLLRARPGGKVAAKPVPAAD